MSPGPAASTSMSAGSARRQPRTSLDELQLTESATKVPNASASVSVLFPVPVSGQKEMP
jgi:hypothetical protein